MGIGSMQIKMHGIQYRMGSRDPYFSSDRSLSRWQLPNVAYIFDI